MPHQSTDDVYEPHGSVTLTLEGRIALSRVTGPWNLELVKTWVKAVRPLERQLRSLQGHATLIVVERSMLTTPDALALMRFTAEMSYTFFHLKACALVAGPDVEGSNFASAIFKPVFDGLSPFAIFDNEADARAWIDRVLNGEVAAAPVNCA